MGSGVIQLCYEVETQISNCCFLTFFVFWEIVFNMYTAVDDTINVLSFCKSLFWYKIAPKRTFCLWTYRVVYSFPEAEALWDKRVLWLFHGKETLKSAGQGQSWTNQGWDLCHAQCSFSINHWSLSPCISITQECGLMSPNQVQHTL